MTRYTKKQHGFTMIELIVVITVIGILTAIAVIGYNGSQQRAHDNAVQTDLRHLGDMLDIFRTKSGITDEFPSTTAQLSSLEFKASKNSYDTTIGANLIVCVSGDKKSFAAVIKSKSNAIYMVTPSGVASFSQPASSFTYASTCSSLGLITVSAGWYSGSWANWT